MRGVSFKKGAITSFVLFIDAYNEEIMVVRVYKLLCSSIKEANAFCLYSF